MKQFLVFLMLIGLILVPAISTAAAVNIYIDSTLGQGNYNGKLLGTELADADLALTTIGFEVCGDKWKAGVEYGSGNFKQYHDTYDYDLFDVKLGYKIFEADNFKTDLTISYANIDNSDNPFAGKIKTASIGADFFYNINDKVNCELDLAYALDGDNRDTLTADLINEVKGTSVKFKANYMFTDNWGAYLGYRYRSILLKRDSLKIWKEDTTGAVIGVNYRF